MFLTIDSNNGRNETFGECFDYLAKTLPAHYLLTRDEREECKEAVGRLQRVFAKFYGRKSQE